MVIRYSNVLPRKFHTVFPIIAPCECDREDPSARYDVRVIGSDKTLLITNVFIKCTSCNSSKLFDIARDKKMLKDIKF